LLGQVRAGFKLIGPFIQGKFYLATRFTSYYDYKPRTLDLRNLNPLLCTSASGIIPAEEHKDFAKSINDMVTFRTYRPSDRSRLSEIYLSNCPKYFGQDDLADFWSFLDQHADENFQVVLADNKVVGCGGFYLKREESICGIAWVMFLRHSLRIRNFLQVSNAFFQNLLKGIEATGEGFDIGINTTQHLEKTFQKFGFTTERVLSNGYGLTLDHYVMRREIST
jgi:hypothetical protein